VLNDKTVHAEAGAIAARYGVRVEHTYQHASQRRDPDRRRLRTVRCLQMS
jgi:hypothetical protein